MKWFGILGLLLTLPLCQSLQAQTAAVTWGTTHQKMDGFGAQDWVGGAGSGVYMMTSAQAAAFFSPSIGIGLQYFFGGNFVCPKSGTCAPSSATIPDLTSMQYAQANGAKIALIMTPPANFQVSGTFYDGTANTAAGIGQGSCVSSTPSYASNMASIASYIVGWVQHLNTNGVKVSTIFPSNEPNAPNPVYNSLGGCVWNASSLDIYIGTYLGPALAAATWNSTQGTAPTISFPKIGYGFTDGTDIGGTCLADSGCAKYIYAVTEDGYGNSGAPDGFTPQNGYCCATTAAPPSNIASSGKQVWMSEVNGGYTYNKTYELWQWDASMSDALPLNNCRPSGPCRALHTGGPNHR